MHAREHKIAEYGLTFMLVLMIAYALTLMIAALLTTLPHDPSNGAAIIQYVVPSWHPLPTAVAP